MKAALILNPRAGRRKHAASAEKIAGELRLRGIDCTVLETGGAGDGANIARQAGEKGFRLVIAAGGDGTMNEVVNGLALDEMTLGILPIGTVNVLARELGIPARLQDAVEVIASGNIRSMDVGCANGRRFILMAGMGFDAAVVGRVRQPLKDLIGAQAYIYEGLKVLASYRPTQVALNMTNGSYIGLAYAVIVANTPSYALNLKIAKSAACDDGLLDVCVFEASGTGKAAFLAQIAAVLAGRADDFAGIRYFQANQVRVDCSPQVPVQVDGEISGMTPVEISILPRALKVLAPG